MSYIDKINVNGTNYDVGKPLYNHPIYANNNTTLRCQFMILNNDATAFNRTTFLAYIKNLMDNGAIINVTGLYVANSVTNSVYMIVKAGSSYLMFYFNSNNNNLGGYVDIDTIFDSAVEIIDGVNQIN